MENETIKPRNTGMSDTSPKARDSSGGIPGTSRDFLWDRPPAACAYGVTPPAQWSLSLTAEPTQTMLDSGNSQKCV